MFIQHRVQCMFRVLVPTHGSVLAPLKFYLYPWEPENTQSVQTGI